MGSVGVERDGLDTVNHIDHNDNVDYVGWGDGRK